MTNNTSKSLTYLQINSSQSVRGSPSLVGRGIANPMSAMTRGFKSLSPRHLIGNIDRALEMSPTFPLSFVENELFTKF